ncbi:MAG TPA: radical SAM protein [Tissierellia bacterium]|nr:radical SAM protein [Tissierellia bacterium]
MVLREISFEILQCCPNNCIYCSSNSNIKSTNIIDFDIFVRVIDDAVSMGLKTLCLSGGEPFLHPNLIDMVKHAKKDGLEVFIYTSGICMKNGENAPLDLERLSILKDLNVDKLIFNMQAAEEGLYDRIMGNKGCFKIMKESIMSASSLGIFTEIHFVPMKININQIDKVIDLASSLGVKKISFLRLVIQGRALKNRSIVELSDEERKKLEDDL